MSGLEALDVGLGLIFIYLLLALSCTAATECIAGMVRLRARTLVRGLQSLLRDDRLQASLLNHPLVSALYRRSKAPAYLAPSTFVMTLTHLLAGSERSGSFSGLREAITQLPPGSSIREALLVLMDNAGQDIGRFRTSLEAWFTETMERAGGWYKARTQTIAFAVGLVIAVLANADTIEIAQTLASDPALREAIVTRAASYAKEHDALPPSATGVDDAARRLRQSARDLQQLALPLGWSETPEGWGWASKILGLLLTTLAMSLGAPFWFDILKKVANLRVSKAAAADRQAAGT